MPRLVVNPHSAAAWEIQLKPGTNSLGRDPVNDWAIADASVSSTHCQILVDDNSVWIKDLGSTNGTFVDRSLITETKLRGGHTIHLGNVELEYYSDEAQTLQEGAPVAAGPQIEPPGTNLTINTTRRTTRIALPVAHDKPAPLTPRGPPQWIQLAIAGSTLKPPVVSFARSASIIFVKYASPLE